METGRGAVLVAPASRHLSKVVAAAEKDTLELPFTMSYAESQGRRMFFDTGPLATQAGAGPTFVTSGDRRSIADTFAYAKSVIPDADIRLATAQDDIELGFRTQAGFPPLQHPDGGGR